MPLVIPPLLGDDPPGIIARRRPLYLCDRPGPAPGALYLPGVRTLVYTTPGAVGRRRRVSEILTYFQFADWAWLVGRAAKPAWATIAADHAKILAHCKPPLLILEDDIELRQWRPNLYPPPDAQLLYLGGGNLGPHGALEPARRAGIPFIRHGRYGYLPIDDTWIRIFGMWFSHAILWLDRDAMRAAADLQRPASDFVDSTYARNQYRWEVACLQTPIFFQNDGHHCKTTYHYYPLPKTKKAGRVPPPRPA